MLYVLEARLERIRPEIERVVSMPGRYRLHQLHQALQILFGWRDQHLHQFRIGTRTFVDAEQSDPDRFVLTLADYESECALCGEDDLDDDIDERDVSLQQVLRRGTQFTYEYDFGEGWRVQIVVRHTEEETDRAYPVVLGGSRAGPPEDCGGVAGYYRLPRTADTFDPSAVQSRLDRRFRGHHKEAVAFEPSPYDPSQGPPRLENFRLATLNLHEQMKVALLEGPMTLEEIAERLTGLGIPLKHGIESLRKAWKRQPPIRQKVDGRLELDRDHPDYWRTEFLFKDALAAPQAASPRPAEPVTVDTATPLRWEELEAAREDAWPFSWSLRRRFMMCLDAHDGPVPMDRLQDDLQRLGQRRPDAVTSSSYRGAAFTQEPDGRIAIVRSDAEVATVRRLFRSWWQGIVEGRNRAHEFAVTRIEGEQRRQQTAAEERRRFQAWRKGVVHLHFHGAQVAGCVLLFPEMEARRFPPGHRVALRQTLESLDLAVGFDPRAAYERIDADLEGRRCLDVSPPFPMAGRSLSEIVDDNVGALPPMATPQEYDRLWQDGDAEGLMARLEQDARTIHAWYRLAVMREGVADWVNDQVEWWHVEWNLGHDPTLPETVRRAIEEKRPVTIEVLPGCVPPGGSPRLEMTPTAWDRDPWDGPVIHGYLADGRGFTVDVPTVLDFVPLE